MMIESKQSTIGQDSLLSSKFEALSDCYNYFNDWNTTSPLYLHFLQIWLERVALLTMGMNSMTINFRNFNANF